MLHKLMTLDKKSLNGDGKFFGIFAAIIAIVVAFNIVLMIAPTITNVIAFNTASIIAELIIRLNVLEHSIGHDLYVYCPIS